MEGRTWMVLVCKRESDLAIQASKEDYLELGIKYLKININELNTNDKNSTLSILILPVTAKISNDIANIPPYM